MMITDNIPCTYAKIINNNHHQYHPHRPHGGEGYVSPTRRPDLPLATATDKRNWLPLDHDDDDNCDGDHDHDGVGGENGDEDDIT